MSHAFEKSPPRHELYDPLFRPFVDAVCDGLEDYKNDNAKALNHLHRAKEFFETANQFSHIPDPYCKLSLEIASRMFLTLGFINLEKKEFQKAIEYFVDGLKVDKANPDFYDFIGHAYYFLGEKIKAIGYYFVALQYSPKSFEIMYSLGLCCMDASIADVGRKYLEDALAIIDSFDAEYDSIKGSIFVRLKRYNDAIYHYQRMQEANYPLAPEDVLNFGTSCYHLGRYDEAIVLCEKVIGISTDSDIVSEVKKQALIYKAKTLLKKDEYDSVAEICKKIEETYPEDETVVAICDQLKKGFDDENTFSSFPDPIELSMKAPLSRKRSDSLPIPRDLSKEFKTIAGEWNHFVDFSETSSVSSHQERIDDRSSTVPSSSSVPYHDTETRFDMDPVSEKNVATSTVEIRKVSGMQAGTVVTGHKKKTLSSSEMQHPSFSSTSDPIGMGNKPSSSKDPNFALEHVHRMDEERVKETQMIESLFRMLKAFSSALNKQSEISYVCCDVVRDSTHTPTALFLCQDCDVVLVRSLIASVLEDVDEMRADKMIVFSPSSLYAEEEFDSIDPWRQPREISDECEKWENDVNTILLHLTNLLAFPRIQYVSYNEKLSRVDVGLVARGFPSLLEDFTQAMNRVFLSLPNGIRVFVHDCWFSEDCVDDVPGCFSPEYVANKNGTVRFNSLKIIKQDGGLGDFPGIRPQMNPYSLNGGVQNSPFRIRPGSALSVRIPGQEGMLYSLGAFVDKNGEIVSPQDFNVNEHFGVSCFHVDLTATESVDTRVFCVALHESVPGEEYHICSSEEIANVYFSKNRSTDFGVGPVPYLAPGSCSPPDDVPFSMVPTLDLALIQFSVPPETLHATVAKSGGPVLFSNHDPIDQYPVDETFHFTGARTGHGSLELFSPKVAITSYHPLENIANGSRYLFLGYATNREYWYGYWFEGDCRKGDSGAAIYHSISGNVIGLLKRRVLVDDGSVVFAIPFPSVSKAIRDFFI